MDIKSTYGNYFEVTILYTYNLTNSFKVTFACILIALIRITHFILF